MAKRVVDEEMRFSVIINGNEAQADLYKLEARNRELNQTLKAQRAEKAKLEAQDKKNTQEYKNLTASISQNNKELRANKTRINELQKQIGITGLTMRQLQQRASQLRLQLRNMVPGSAQYQKFQTELQQINTRLKSLRGNAVATRSSLSKLADGFNKYAALGASVIATGTGIVLSLQKMIDYNAKLSDAQSDVRKTTGLTKAEVDELSKSFGLMKTRTARIELLELATEAGRLGIKGVENINNFVKTANKLKVALGDDLSTEQIREVGKIATIYKVGEKNNMDYATSFEAVGSAINEVAASGANQAGFLVDYLKRTSGIAQQTNIAAEANIGYAATFDEIGQSVEISATAMNKVFIDMFSNTKEYAKIAGMTEEAFGKLMNTDANEAMIRFLEGLNGNNEGFAVMVKRMEAIEAGGARGAQALSAMAANTDLLRSRQKLAGEALRENTSVTNEAELKNNNLAASLDKIRKRMAFAFSSEGLVKNLEGFVVWFAKFIGASEDADGRVSRFRNGLIILLKTIVVITAATLSYNSAVRLTALFTNNAYKATKLYELVQRVSLATTRTLRSAKLLLSAAYYLVTGNITRATAAMRVFNTVSKLNPLGLVLGVITTVVAAYIMFSKNAKEAATSQQQLAEATKSAEVEIAAEKHQLQQLLKVAQDETKSKKERQKAIDELNRTIPEYNNQLTLENVNTKAAAEMLDTYIEKIKLAAKVKFMKSLVDKKAEEIAAAENSNLEENIGWLEKTWAFIKAGGNVAVAASNAATTAVENKTETITRLNEELRNAQKTLDELNAQQNTGGSTEGGPTEGDTKTIGKQKFVFRNGKWELVNPYTPTPTDEPNTTATSSLQKEQEALLNMQRKYQDDRIALINDAFQREMAQNDIAHLRKIEDLEGKASQLLEAFDGATADGNTQLANTYLDQYNAVFNQIEQEEVNHQAKRNEILEKGIQDHITKLQEQHAREETERETAFQNELAALGDNEEAKKALEEQFNKEKLDRQKANQQLLIDELNKILDTSKFEDFSLDLLTEEQTQAIRDRLMQLGLSLAEVNALLAQMHNGGAVEETSILGMTPGDIDIFGFSVEQWETTFSNLDQTKEKLEATLMVATGMLNAYKMFSDFQSANEASRIKKLEASHRRESQNQKRLLDGKFISQKQYEDAVKGSELELEKKKEEIAKKQAKRERIMTMAGIALNTAQAIMSIWAQVPKFDFGISAGLLTGFVSALGAAQMIAAAKVKGYETGFYPVQREQDGKMFNAAFGGESRSGVVDKPTVFLAGEGGKNFPELIVDGRTLKQFNPELKDSLYRELSRIKGFEAGYYKPQENGNSVPGLTNQEMSLFVSTLARTNALLDNLEKNGVTAYMDKSMRNLQKFQEEFQKLIRIQNKSKL